MLFLLNLLIFTKFLISNLKTSEKQIKAKEQGSERSKGASEEIVYRIEIPANRLKHHLLLLLNLLIFLHSI